MVSARCLWIVGCTGPFPNPALGACAGRSARGEERIPDETRYPACTDGHPGFGRGSTVGLPILSIRLLASHPTPSQRDASRTGADGNENPNADIHKCSFDPSPHNRPGFGRRDDREPRLLSRRGRALSRGLPWPGAGAA